jgi:hypothetical protein
MTRPNPILFAIYRAGLRLYPARIRSHYKDQILQTVRDTHAERGNSFLFWFHLFTDLLRSSVQERLLMTSDELIRRPIFFHAVTLGLILTLMGAAASGVFQQMLRRGADQPQLQMAERYTSELTSGKKPEEVIPPDHVDLEQSLEPFAIFYNDQGAPVSSTGYLNVAIPAPPRGVFDFVRTNGSEKVTWQPQPGVRIASIVRRADGANPGFVLTGRSLRVVEEQEAAFWRMTFTAWFILVGLLAGGAFLLSRAQMRHATA